MDSLYSYFTVDRQRLRAAVDEALRTATRRRPWRGDRSTACARDWPSS